MYKKILSIVLTVAMITTLSPLTATAQITAVKTAPSYEKYLSDWVMSPSVSGTTCGLPGGADTVILAPDYSTANWLKAKVPSSVLGNCIDDGVYNDFFMNRSGTTDEWNKSGFATPVLCRI